METKNSFSALSVIFGALFGAFIIFQGVYQTDDWRIHIGILLLIAAVLFGVISQFPGVRKSFYALQVKKYRENMSEEMLQKNGLISAIVLLVTGVTLVVMSRF
ncbi:MAG TPA: hypothetical protein VK914_12240 [bacterium]|jgi:hypothetical protein|nr:hypothetical protein [bacterium]